MHAIGACSPGEAHHCISLSTRVMPCSTNQHGGMIGCARMRAGLTFFDLGEAPQDTFQRLSALFFIMLLFELLPFCYMSFYVADRQCALVC